MSNREREASYRPAVVEQFIAEARPGRAELIAEVDRTIRQAAPALEAGREGRFLGYGPFHYRYDSGREGDTFVVSMMDGAQALSLYVMGTKDGGYLAEANAERLGKVSVGKSCIRIRRLEHLDLDVLAEVVAEAAAQHQG